MALKAGPGRKPSTLLAGALAGALGGAVWALVQDRTPRTAAQYGATDKTMAAPLALYLFMFLAMLFFGG